MTLIITVPPEFQNEKIKDIKIVLTRASLGPSKLGVPKHGHHRVIPLQVFVIILQKETNVSDYLARRTFSSFETAQQVFIRLIPT